MTGFWTLWACHSAACSDARGRRGSLQGSGYACPQEKPKARRRDRGSSGSDEDDDGEEDEEEEEEEEAAEDDEGDDTIYERNWARSYERSWERAAEARGRGRGGGRAGRPPKPQAPQAPWEPWADMRLGKFTPVNVRLLHSSRCTVGSVRNACTKGVDCR